MNTNLNWLFKMAWRDSRRNYSRLLLFISSIVLGIAALVAIYSLGYNLQQNIDSQAAELLGDSGVTVPVLLTASGLAAVFSLLGIVGAALRKRFLLLIYLVLFSVAFLLAFVSVVYDAVHYQPNFIIMIGYTSTAIQGYAVWYMIKLIDQKSTRSGGVKYMATV